MSSLIDVPWRPPRKERTIFAKATQSITVNTTLTAIGAIDTIIG